MATKTPFTPKEKKVYEKLDENCPLCWTQLIIKELYSSKINKYTKKEYWNFKIKECPNYKLSKDEDWKWLKDWCNFSEIIKQSKEEKEQMDKEINDKKIYAINIESGEKTELPF